MLWDKTHMTRHWISWWSWLEIGLRSRYVGWAVKKYDGLKWCNSWLEMPSRLYGNIFHHLASPLLYFLLSCFCIGTEWTTGCVFMWALYTDYGAPFGWGGAGGGDGRYFRVSSTMDTSRTSPSVPWGSIPKPLYGWIREGMIRNVPCVCTARLWLFGSWGD